MKYIAKFAASLLAGLLVNSNVIAQSDIVTFGGGKPNFIVIGHGDIATSSWSAIHYGAMMAAKDIEVSVDFLTPDSNNLNDFATLVKQAISKKPHGLVVSIPEANLLEPILAHAMRQGIPVIAINEGAEFYESLGIDLYVGQDDYKAGMAAGERMTKQGNDNAICLSHQLGNVAYEQRCQGFKDGFAGKVTLLQADADPLAMKNSLKKALSDRPSTDALLTMEAATAGEIAIKAIKELGYQVDVGSFGFSEHFLRSINAGKAVFSIDQQYYLQGYLPISILAQHARTGLMPSGHIITGSDLITAAKVTEYRNNVTSGIR